MVLCDFVVRLDKHDKSRAVCRSLVDPIRDSFSYSNITVFDNVNQLRKQCLHISIISEDIVRAKERAQSQECLKKKKKKPCYLLSQCLCGREFVNAEGAQIWFQSHIWFT